MAAIGFGVGLSAGLLMAWLLHLLDRAQRDVSTDALDMALRRDWREGSSDVDVEGLRHRR